MKTIDPDFYEHPCTQALVEFVEDKQPKHVLDLGCGNGRDLNFLIKHNLIEKGVGVDDHHTPKIYSEFIETSVKIRFVKSDILTFQCLEEENTYDFICYNNSLEHLSYWEYSLKESFRLLKPNGWVMILAPYQMAHNDPDHKVYFSEVNLVLALANAKFRVSVVSKILGDNIGAIGEAIKK